MRQITPLARALFRYQPVVTAALVALLLVAALLEGLAMVVLIPLLQGVLAPELLQGQTGGPLERYLPRFDGIPQVLLFFVLVTLTQGVIRYLADTRRSRLLLGFLETLRLRVFDAIAHADWLDLTRRHRGEFVQVLSTEVERVGVAVDSLIQLITSSSVAMILLVISVRLSPTITLVALGCGLLLSLGLRQQSRRATQAGSQLTRTHQTLQESLQDYLACLKSIKAHHQEDRHARHFADALSDARQQQQRFARYHALSQSGFRVGAAICLSVIIYVATVLLAVPASTLLVMVVIFARMMPMLSSLLLTWQQLIFMLPAYQQLCAVTESLEKQRDRSVTAPARLEFTDSIRFEDVSFAYPGKDPVLRGLNLRIPRNSLTVVTGASGAGKTTLVDMLCGLIRPTSGRILIDGTMLDETTRAGWQQQLACVGQDPVLFHDTIDNNLRWMQPDVSEAAIRAALAQAEASFVNDLPDRLQTVVGDRGGLLSGGQRQRLALAQALVSQPRLLILDEVTSALDSTHAQAIMRTVVRLAEATTVVLVTHKPDDVPRADQWITLGEDQALPRGDAEPVRSPGGVPGSPASRGGSR